MDQASEQGEIEEKIGREEEGRHFFFFTRVLSSNDEDDFFFFFGSAHRRFVAFVEILPWRATGNC